MGCLCNQKEIRHQLLTLAGCGVLSRCCLSLLVLRVVVFFFRDIIVLVNLLFILRALLMLTEYTVKHSRVKSIPQNDSSETEN